MTTINLDDIQLELLNDWLSDKVQCTYDDPWSYADDEDELEAWLMTLKRFCDVLKLDFGDVVNKQATHYEIREMNKILPDVAWLPKDR